MPEAFAFATLFTLIEKTDKETFWRNEKKKTESYFDAIFSLNCVHHSILVIDEY
jgi:hypothetical protein